jgi:hypothetical protein
MTTYLISVDNSQVDATSQKETKTIGKVCSKLGCGRPVKAKGLCNRHWKQEYYSCDDCKERKLRQDAINQTRYYNSKKDDPEFIAKRHLQRIKYDLTHIAQTSMSGQGIRIRKVI